MNESWEFTEPDSVVPGAFGEPGHRTFFVQVRDAGRIVSFKLEKQQVAALCDYLEGILADLPTLHPGQFIAPLSATEPSEMQWAVGSLAVAYEEDQDRLVIVAEELPDFDDSFEGEFDEEFSFDAATARFCLSRAQVAAFIAVGSDLVRAGRPACRLCGRPMDLGGHPCPRLN
ncbi:MAG: DUF3090 family protein [Acidimicrobiales bacterium]